MDTNLAPPTAPIPEPLAPAGELPPPTGAPRARAPRSRRTVAAIALACVLAVASMPLGNEAPLGILALFCIAAPLERRWRRHPVPWRRLGLRTDLAYAVAGPALQAAGLAVAVVIGALSLTWLPALALRPLVAALPGGVRFVVGFALADLAVYWTHRLQHEVPALWRFHAVHHSTVHLDWISGLRSHPLDGVAAAPAFAFLLGAGFGIETTGVLAALRVVVGLWAHLNVRWRWRPLQRIVLTPELHHWHHSLDPVGQRSNYSTLFPAWDLLFGTWYAPADRRPERYGIAGPMPLGFVAQLAQPFRRR